jgi:hypothetical protein
MCGLSNHAGKTEQDKSGFLPSVPLPANCTEQQINAQQQLYAAKRDLAKAYHGYLMSRLRLSAEAGELDEDTLIQINAMLIR